MNSFCSDPFHNTEVCATCGGTGHIEYHNGIDAKGVVEVGSCPCPDCSDTQEVSDDE